MMIRNKICNGFKPGSINAGGGHAAHIQLWHRDDGFVCSLINEIHVPGSDTFSVNASPAHCLFAVYSTAEDKGAYILIRFICWS